MWVWFLLIISLQFQSCYFITSNILGFDGYIQQGGGGGRDLPVPPGSANDDSVPTGPFKVVKCIIIISTYINWIKNFPSSDKILNTPTATEGVLKICSEQRMSENRWLIWWAKLARFELIKILWSWKRSQFNFFHLN